MKPPRVKKSTHEIGRRVIECGHACLYDLDFILDSIQRHAKIETGPASQVLSDALSMIQQTDQRRPITNLDVCADDKLDC
jgi:hypothetical protein